MKSREKNARAGPENSRNEPKRARRGCVNSMDGMKLSNINRRANARSERAAGERVGVAHMLRLSALGVFSFRRVSERSTLRR